MQRKLLQKKIGVTQLGVLRAAVYVSCCLESLDPGFPVSKHDVLGVCLLSAPLLMPFQAPNPRQPPACLNILYLCI